MNYFMDTLLKAKELFNPSSLGDASKTMTYIDGIAKWLADKSPAPNSGGGISYQAKSAEEYEKVIEVEGRRLDIEYKHSGKQSRDKMLERVLSPLTDYLFQRFGTGLQQIMPQQQPMSTQSQRPIQPTPKPSYGPPKPQSSQPQMTYVFRPPDQYEVTCPQCSTPVDVALDSISVNRCTGCGILVLVVEDSPENAEYIKQMKSNQWTEELTDKIKLAVQRYSEVAVKGLALNTRPLVNESRGDTQSSVEESKSPSDDPLMGTFLAVAVREGIAKYLGGVSTNTINSLVEKNVGVDTIWKMIPQGFEESMATYSNEHPDQLRYVLNPTWVMRAIHAANPSLAEYFTDHPTGRAWLNGIISGIGSKLGVFES